MKITSVDFLVLDRQFPFVLVHTDEVMVGVSGFEPPASTSRT